MPLVAGGPQPSLKALAISAYMDSEREESSRRAALSREVNQAIEEDFFNKFLKQPFAVNVNFESYEVGSERVTFQLRCDGYLFAGKVIRRTGRPLLWVISYDLRREGYGDVEVRDAASLGKILVDEE